VWDGIYFGGQVGYSSANVNYGDSLHSMSEYLLRNLVIADQVSSMTTLPQESVHSRAYGGFIGYNYTLFSNLVVGAELNYSRLDLSSASSATTSALIHNDNGVPTGHHLLYDVNVTGSASLRIKDYASFRARAGWQVDQFLPYAFVAGVVGRADYSVTDTINFTTTDTPDPASPPITPLTFAPFSGTKTESKSDAIAYGAAAGLGVEVALISNVFLRAEWEYVYFSPIHDIQVSINSGHVGVGIKF
jgi:opacity protein-like surface antigen